MKKVLMTLALAGMSFASFAQEADLSSGEDVLVQEDNIPVRKYSVLTNGFWDNWFFQGGLAGTSFYSNEEKHLGYSKNPLSRFRRDLGFAFAFGKWFNPTLGIRAHFNGIWGKSVWVDDYKQTKIYYWNSNAEALLNVSNLIWGYNPDRTWDFIPYFGAGITRNCSYNTYELSSNMGVINSFKINDKWSWYLDFHYTLCGDDFEGVVERKIDTDDPTLKQPHKNLHHDRFFTLELGLTYKLGKWQKAPDLDAINNMHQGQLDALNAQIADLQKDLEREPEVVHDTAVVSQAFRDFVTTPISVFFDCAKINVANLKDLVNVQALVRYARLNNSTLLVTGYADSSTGSPELNERLSIQRAETLKGELIKMGIAPEKIRVTHHGGVDLLGKKAPKEFDRRATVQIIDEE
jgi:outer membrane protein OmpA-like peptidoglycan-associated protein